MVGGKSGAGYPPFRTSFLCSFQEIAAASVTSAPLPGIVTQMNWTVGRPQDS